MGSIFHLKEIVEFAVQREQESYTMYRDLAEKTETDDVKILFSTLMEEEQQHRDYYSQLAGKVDQITTPGTHKDQEWQLYMEEQIASSRKTNAMPPLDATSMKEILDFAIAREKDSIIFYVGLETFVADKDKQMIYKIIKEEGNHIAALSQLKKTLI